MKIGTRLTIGFLLNLLLMIAMALYLANISQKSLEASVGGNTVFITEQMLDRMNQYIYHKVELLQLHAKHELLQETLKESNGQFQGIPNIDEYLSRREKEWVSTPRDSMTPLVRGVMDNRLSASLKKEFIDFYDRKYGYTVFSEIIVTNKYGAAVAVTGRTSGYRNDTYNNWKNAGDKGSFVSDIEYDESSDTYGVTIAVRVDDDQGRFIGVIVGILSIKDVITKAEISARNYETMEIHLLTKDGKLIYATKAFSFLQDVSGKVFYKKIMGEDGFFIAEEGNRKRLFSYAYSQPYLNYRGLNAILLVSYDTKEVLEPIVTLAKAMGIAALAFLIIGILIVYFTTRSITRPIAGLNRMVEEVGAKKFDATIDTALLARKDEFGSLTGAFKEMVENLKDAQDKLVRGEKMALLGQLSGGVAHELRNPLGAIKNAAYFLKMALEKPDPEVHESIEIIGKEVAISEGIINSILSFARPKQPVMRKTDINDLIKEALSRITMPKNVAVSTEWGALPTILADPDQLGQAFGNIIRNAVQAMHEGGRLTIKTQAPDAGHIAVSVADTGAGIPEENIKKIFEPLFTTKAKGVGLGLALTKTLVEGHGGTIKAKSKVGKGSTFTVRLPVGIGEGT
jgi:signal transduction histidine kinase